ncbi:MAG: matrixin family metalloprotease [Deltaproteobacteria bacterium]|nr:matrixin family metalloprotease [Deltaproteobacteria bacterium]
MDRRQFLQASSIIVMAACLPGRLRAAEKKKLYLQPMGVKLSDKDVAMVKEALREFYAFEVVDLPRIKMPKSAWYSPRKRWRAEKILDVLEELAPKDAHRILGLTGQDISTTKGKYEDWGVMGLASIDGLAGVMSMLRCRKSARNRKHARIRFAKVAVHEIGHTLGLPHCPTRGCLMEDAKGRASTCDREYDFCDNCRKALKKWNRPIPAFPKIPWPRPK